MKQEDMFGTYAEPTGLTIRYHLLLNTPEGGGILTITPTWSKHPRQAGNVQVALDLTTQDCLPELLWEAGQGFNCTDPGYYIPRRVKNHLSDYQHSPQ